ncbi:hypothetical protein IWX90DRAFT_379545 [Phyllosticta citrichinensis]|uniref:CUE domain-containing protein n=1 Tax=Phyllosticta citrichinensis TaxID=1130410 RepID=A0ABR1Y4T4_9PEZI
MSDASSTFNIPQLIVIVVVSFLLFRWYSSASPAGGAADGSSNSRNGAPRVNPAAVEQVALMFPQLQRRDIMWDLSRNGSNVAATTERILSGRGLEVPPPSYQPPMPTARTAASTPIIPKSQKVDLITRYHLADKINDESAAAEETSQKTTWSQNKTERQRILQKRRQEMVLAARRRMLEKDKASSAPAS